MPSLDEAAALALRLPEVAEAERRGTRTWSVRDKVFAWERPFTKADIRRFGSEMPPGGPILAVRVADLSEKQAILAAHPGVFFTIPHFDGFSAILIQLDEAEEDELGEALVDAWLWAAPPDLARAWIEKGPGPGPGP
ncbi:MAG: MmcQ/YjbR family DNA-binding protein [Acidimicrobiales bacterium]